MKLNRKLVYFTIIPFLLILLSFYYLYHYKKSYYHIVELKEIGRTDRLNIEAFQQSVSNILGDSYAIIIRDYLSNEYFEEVYYNSLLQSIDKRNFDGNFKIILRKGILPHQTNKSLNLILISKKLDINNAQILSENLLSKADTIAKNEINNQLKSLLNLFTKFNISLNIPAEDFNYKPFDINVANLIDKLKAEYEIALTLGIIETPINDLDILDINSLELYKFGTTKILKTISKLEDYQKLKKDKAYDKQVVGVSKKRILNNSFDQMFISSNQFKVLNYNISSMYSIQLPHNRNLQFLFYISIIILISGIIFYYLMRYLKQNES
tara:strand:- start:169 stop:1140 length:972 start_codon:yes stop_codon:yes gene_type:complete